MRRFLSIITDAVPPLFDSYVMVDWSAAAAPRQGKDSIWIAWLNRDSGVLLENPPTRAAATARLAGLLDSQPGRVLAGFDFPQGYPAGFAARLAPGRADWTGVWAGLAARLNDRDDNSNDRFLMAGAINTQLAGEAGWPFWGCPQGRSVPALHPDKRAWREGPPSLAEYRIAEARTKGVQSTWKLTGVGSVGSQVLTGIPRLEQLRHHPNLAKRIRIWPFETGLVPISRLAADAIIFAEIWPSLYPRDDHPIRDAGQVSATVRAFAAFDEAGDLGALFGGDPYLSARERLIVEREEGWILGVRDTPPPRPPRPNRAAS